MRTTGVVWQFYFRTGFKQLCGRQLDGSGGAFGVLGEICQVSNFDVLLFWHRKRHDEKQPIWIRTTRGGSSQGSFFSHFIPRKNGETLQLKGFSLLLKVEFFIETIRRLLIHNFELRIFNYKLLIFKIFRNECFFFLIRLNRYFL